ncbi:DUF397 domain-containing protein [Paractinoplanes lichenicola]|uniref:DUF397 domain-containing protein n=1 Tax=Paractinoplanes lichenicola TaxID=2802976 RepID=A0ABS1VNY9_9ACTN|nr:DUF397 domain-containing protein [Actinoplanes lichenicola]MBL7256355.1 DUF397 domain-containing protein [Actinoplanes lichenicola]
MIENDQNSTPQWRTSSFCSNGSCVEVASFGDSIAVRDTKNRNKAPFHYTLEAWRDFVVSVQKGEFDVL